MWIVSWQDVKIQLLTNCSQLVMWVKSLKCKYWDMLVNVINCFDWLSWLCCIQDCGPAFLLVIWSLAFGTGTGKCRHHTIDCLQERGMERGSARQSSLKGWKRVVIDQMNIGTVLKGSIGDTSECIDTIFNWTGKIWVCDSSWGDQMTDTNMEDR